MLIFDLETDGLLCDVTKIHCLCIHDTETEQTMVYNDQSFKHATDKPATEPIIRGLQYLEDAECIIGHNIIGYDLAIINKLYPGLDALVIAWILFCSAVCITQTS